MPINSSQNDSFIVYAYKQQSKTYDGWKTYNFESKYFLKVDLVNCK